MGRIDKNRGGSYGYCTLNNTLAQEMGEWGWTERVRRMQGVVRGLGMG